MLVHIILFIILLLFFYVVLKIFKNFFKIAINSIIGAFAFVGFNIIFGASIKITFFSVILTAIGGIFGFSLVLTLHYLGLAF